MSEKNTQRNERVTDQEDRSRGVRTDIGEDITNSRIYTAADDINIIQQGDQALVSYWLGRPASLDDYFVGREAELRDIADAFKEHRLVVVSGGAATGKSRLAAEYTHRSQLNGFWTTAATGFN